MDKSTDVLLCWIVDFLWYEDVGWPIGGYFGYWGIEDRLVVGSPGSSLVLLYRHQTMTPPFFGDKSIFE